VTSRAGARVRLALAGAMVQIRHFSRASAACAVATASPGKKHQPSALAASLRQARQRRHIRPSRVGCGVQPPGCLHGSNAHIGAGCPIREVHRRHHRRQKEKEHARGQCWDARHLPSFPAPGGGAEHRQNGRLVVTPGRIRLRPAPDIDKDGQDPAGRSAGSSRRPDRVSTWSVAKARHGRGLRRAQHHGQR
jgi:hypothetical protein